MINDQLFTANDALTFDDLLIEPGYSEILPSQTSIRARLAAGIYLNIPILSAAMDTVTEAKLAIALAREGGIGILHRNLSPEAQAKDVDTVKRSESGMILIPSLCHQMQPFSRPRTSWHVSTSAAFQLLMLKRTSWLAYSPIGTSGSPNPLTLPNQSATS